MAHSPGCAGELKARTEGVAICDCGDLAGGIGHLVSAAVAMRDVLRASPLNRAAPRMLELLRRWMADAKDQEGETYDVSRDTAALLEELRKAGA